MSLDVEPALVEETTAERTRGRDAQRRRVRRGDDHHMVLPEDVREGRDRNHREQGKNDPASRPLDEMTVVTMPLQLDAVGGVRRAGHGGLIPSARALQTAGLTSKTYTLIGYSSGSRSR